MWLSVGVVDQARSTPAGAAVVSHKHEQVRLSGRECRRRTAWPFYTAEPRHCTTGMGQLKRESIGTARRHVTDGKSAIAVNCLGEIVPRAAVNVQCSNGGNVCGLGAVYINGGSWCGLTNPYSSCIINPHPLRRKTRPVGGSRER